jgi:molecular chaperone DnaJ
MGDILSNLFGGAGGGSGPTRPGGGAGGANRGGRRARVERGNDLEAQVSISFDQAISGAQIPLSVPMRTTCGTCHGTGAKPGTTPVVCPRCEGRGVEPQGQGMFSISRPCSRCGGSGTVIEDPCPTCHGSGAVRTVKKLRVNIPAGVRDGGRIRLAGKGEPGPGGGPPGDLYLVVHVSSSPVFARKGNNLEVEVPLTIPEALRGAEVQVPTLNGAKTLRVAPGTRHGTVQRLRGEGPTTPGSGKPPKKGDIHYRFLIDVPKELTEEQAQAVEALAQTLEGTDPRARLFEGARAGHGGAEGS